MKQIDDQWDVAYRPLPAKELMESVGHRIDAFIRDWYRGIKLIRFNSYANSDGSGNLAAVVIPGPESGYVWDLKRISIIGPAIYNSTSGPFANIFRGAVATDAVDSAFVSSLVVSNATTWPKLAVTYTAGENLLISGGNMAVNATALINGQAIEVPAEMLGKLV